VSNLQQRQSKIQEKRKKTPWRQYVQEIASWASLSLYKRGTAICRYPDTLRVNTIPRDQFIAMRDGISSDYSLNLDEDSIKSRSFFDNLKDLFAKTPLPYQHLWQSENCDYTDTWGYSKNVYLSFLYGGTLENACYCWNSKFSRNVYNSCAVWDNSENVYQCTGITQSYNVFYSKNIHASRDIWLCSDMTGCEDCVQCRGLTNQKYMINNEQLTEEEYVGKKNEILSHKEQFDEIYSAMQFNTDAQTGCEDVVQSRVVYNIKSGRNVMYSGWWSTKERFYDVFAGWAEADFYGVYQWVNFASHVYCSAHINASSNIFYSYSMNECSFCLGCVGLKNKSFCILNKQYTKEERLLKIDEIFWRMDADGILWDALPASLNPFYFNDTAAYLIDPSFSKEEVMKAWFMWRDQEIKVDIPDWMETVKKDDLDTYERVAEGGKRTLDETILKKVILDEKGNAYRVVKMEYDFLVKYALPLPRKHRLDRLKENFRVN